MSFQNDFLLERLVHHVTATHFHAQATGPLIADALAAGADPEWLLAEVLLPAAECMQQLRHDGLLSPHAFSNASRTLQIMGSAVASHMSAARTLQCGMPGIATRRLMIMSAPGEPSDTGAFLLTLLAEAHGFQVLFAGGDLTGEDLLFALERLAPAALVLHGSIATLEPETGRLFRQIKRAGFWPGMQLALAGAMIAGKCADLEADLNAAHPVEILELLALCPEFRATTSGAGTLRLAYATHAPSKIPQSLLMRLFPARAHLN